MSDEVAEYGNGSIGKKAKTATCDVPGCTARITIVAQRGGFPFTVDEYLELEGWFIIWTSVETWTGKEKEATTICPEHGPVVDVSRVGQKRV